MRTGPAMLLLVLLAIAGCSSGRELAMPRGAWFQLNPTHWTAQAGDLRGPEAYR